MQVMLNSSFRPPGFSGKEREGKEGEFRNWTYYTMALADSNTVVFNAVFARELLGFTSTRSLMMNSKFH